MSISTLHGDIVTPAFMPDATYGTVKSMTFKDLADVGVRELVTTTLHIEQKLGSKYIKEFGGLHKFFNWDRPILTDSGGFQVFSLIHRNPNKYNKITNAGASFIEPARGDYQLLTPEISQIIQYNLGSDIRVVLDEPVVHEGSYAQAKDAVIRTTEWAKRSKAQFLKLHDLSEADFDNPQVKRPLLVGVIQGGNFLELRKQSAIELQEIGFDIYGFGGLPLHNSKRWNYEHPVGFHHELLEYVSGLVQDKPKYGLGIGTPDDLMFCSALGWQLFDTVLPTRNARHGLLYVSKESGDQQFKEYDTLHLKTKQYEFDQGPVDPDCDCECCRTVSRAYLRYLLKIDEPSGFRLASIHNLHFYMELMQRLQQLNS